MLDTCLNSFTIQLSGLLLVDYDLLKGYYLDTQYQSWNSPCSSKFAFALTVKCSFFGRKEFRINQPVMTIELVRREKEEHNNDSLLPVKCHVLCWNYVWKESCFGTSRHNHWTNLHRVYNSTCCITNTGQVGLNFIITDDNVSDISQEFIDNIIRSIHSRMFYYKVGVEIGRTKLNCYTIAHM